jgi:uncharacterized protein (DUF2267 family)
MLASKRSIIVFTGWYDIRNHAFIQHNLIIVMTASLNYTYSPEENAALFFRHVKKELGIPSTKHLVKIVSKVVTHLRSSLSNAQITNLVSRLPEVFQLMLIHKWEPNEEKKTFTHLDEFVESIYAEDRESLDSIFATEVETLQAVIIILRKLDKYLHLFSFDILKHPMMEELKQIPMEDVA